MATSTSHDPSDPYLVFKTSCHGFPHHASCMAYDPLQQLLAIGSHHGVVTILGRKALERRVEHSPGYRILQIQFGINRGLLLSLGCSDENDTVIFLWSFVEKNIVLMDRMQLSLDKMRSIYWPHGSDWVYIGCEGGDVHFACVQSNRNHLRFVRSDDVIHWNKAAQLRSCRRDNPGEVLALQENPLDPSKLLVGYSRGLCLVWNLKEKNPLLRYTRETTPSAILLLTSTCWHSNGKAIVVGYSDGCVLEVEVKTGQILQMLNVNTGGGMLGCLPIFGVQSYNAKDGGPWILFSGGGLLRDQQSAQTLTVWSKNVVKELQFAGSVVDFICLPSTPFPADVQSPTALVILTEQEVLAFDMRCDLQVESPAPIQLPYTLLLHPTPVTFLHYCGLCSTELEAQLLMIKTKLLSHKVKQSGSPKVAGNAAMVQKAWPIHGGNWDDQAMGWCPRLIVTGHQDGTVRFWLSYEDIFEPALSINTASYFAASSPSQHKQKRGGASQPHLHSSEKTSTDSAPFSIDLVKVSLTHQNFCVVNRRGDVLLFKTEISNHCITVNTHNILLHFEDAGEEEEVRSRGLPISEECWKFHPMKSDESHPSLKLIQHCRCVIDNQGSMEAVEVIAVDYCPTVGMLAVGTQYGIAILDTHTNCCDHIITGIKKLMSLADPSFVGNFKRVRMQKKHKIKANQPFKLLTGKKNSSSKMSVPQGATTSSLCDVSVLEAVYLCLDGHSTTPSLTLWVGTASGEVAVFGIHDKGGSGHKRLELVSTGITISKPSKVLELLFLTDRMVKIESATEWHPTQAVPTSVPNYVILATTELLKSYSLPDKKCLGRVELREDMGEIVSSSYSIIEERALLATLLCTGQLLIHSLPDLQPMAELSSLPMQGPSALNTFSLGSLGRGAYKCSPTEIQEVTVHSSAFDRSYLWKYLPQLYIPREEAAAPKPKGFVANFLTSQSHHTPCQREEYFHTVAKRSSVPAYAHSTTLPGGGGDDMPDGVDTESQHPRRYVATDPYNRVKQNLSERKDKLNKLTIATEQLAGNASDFNNAARLLREKYTK